MCSSGAVGEENTGPRKNHGAAIFPKSYNHYEYAKTKTIQRKLLDSDDSACNNFLNDFNNKGRGQHASKHPTDQRSDLLTKSTPKSDPSLKINIINPTTHWP